MWNHGRRQEFQRGGAIEPIKGGSGNLFWGSNQVLQSKLEGEAQIEGAKHLRIELRKNGERSGEGTW